MTPSDSARSRSGSAGPPSSRSLALDLLIQFDQSPFPVSGPLEQVEGRLEDPRERHLARALVTEVLRHRSRLDWVVARWLRRGGVNDLPATARNVLRIGAVQLLLFDRIPQHAAVNSSVDLARSRGAAGLPGLVNAVLRKVARDGRAHWDELDASSAPTSSGAHGSRGAKASSGAHGSSGAKASSGVHGSRGAKASSGVHGSRGAKASSGAHGSRGAKASSGVHGSDSAHIPRAALLALRHSHPDWLVARWVERWGEARTEAILRWDNTAPDYWLRLSPGAGPPAGSIPGWIPGTARLPAGSRPGSSEGFRAGEFTIQDGSAILVGWLPPRVSGLVFDLCAAPGTKLSHLMERAERDATLVALDKSPPRLRRLLQGAGRLNTDHHTRPRAGGSDDAAPEGTTLMDTGHPSSTPEDRAAPRVYVAAGDAALIPARGPWRGALIDAPCSNLGVLRRRVDARWRVEPGEIPQLASLQATLLESAARNLEPGGWLVYSVCTVEPEETIERRREFMKRHPDWEPIPLPEFVPPNVRMEPGELLLLPGQHETDGTYAFAVRRPGGTSGSRGD